MDKPICRVCKKPHWNSEPHIFSEEVSPKKFVPTRKKGKPKKISEIVAKTDKRKSTGAKFDKVAYQREYMRKRRAKEK